MKVRRLVLTCLIICATLCSVLALSACDGFSSCNNETGKTYVVSYDRGAEDATGTIPEAVSYAEGATVTLAAADTFTRNGYTFEKWSYGDKTYDAGAEFTMPKNDVTFTAVWKSTEEIPVEEKDEPTLCELADKFYSAENWVYMTNNNGASSDIGDIPYSLDDGSIKFHRLNQAIEMGDMSNATASFMLKGTNDWSIWFNSSSIDNNNNYSYRLAYAYGGLRLSLSSAPDLAAAVVSDSSYEKAEWNRIDIVFETSEKTCNIKLYINGERAELVAGDALSGVTVSDNVLTHVQPAMFTTGNYMVVKVWEAHNYLQIKPVAKANEKDVPVIACIGASITEGAGAGNFYTESYPAQLQNALGGSYNVINFGNSGKTVKLNPEDGEAWLAQNQWTGVQAIVPDIAILNIGTNDSKTANNPSYDSFKAAYEYLLEQILSVNPQMKIYICTVPYAYTAVYGISNENIRDIIAPVQREIAQENGYELIDLYNIVQNKSLLFGDGVHPNTTGYTMFVEIITKVLEEGQEGLTQDFLDYIDEKYNDPAYELTDIRGEIAVSGDAINLTVTGNIVMEDVSKLRLVVETGTEGEEAEVAMIPDADGDFSGTINLAVLTSTKWYNVRVYLTETFYYFVRLNETDCAVGDIFHTDSRLVTVRSWSSGGENTFSFTVGGYTAFEFTSSVIKDNVLTVSGVTGDSGIRLYVGINPAQTDAYNEYKTITVGEDGTFTASFDLSELPVGGWYNARIYFTDGSYKTVPLAQTTDGTNALSVGDYFLCESTKVVIKSWTDGGIATLSFEVTAFSGVIPELNLTEATITTSDGKIILTVEGTTNDDAIRLYIGNAESNSDYYHAITVATDGSFTVDYDLATLVAGSGWYNVRIYYSDNTYFVVTYTAVKYEGNVLTTSDVFTGINDNNDENNKGVKVSIKTWGNDKPLSLLVETYDTSYSVTATEVKMENGKLVFTGTTKNVTELNVALVNNDDVVTADGTDGTVTINDDGTFTVEIALDNLTANAGNWYYLRTKANGADAWSYVDYAKTSDTFVFGERRYRWEYYNGGIAVAYAAYTGPTVTLESAIIEQSGNSVTLTISGTVTDTSDLYDKTLLYIGNDANNADSYHEVTLNGNSFTVSYDLATLGVGNGIQIRFYHSRTDSDAKWGYYTLKFTEVTVNGSQLQEGATFEVDGLKITATTSADWKPIELSVEDTSFECAITNVKFDNGYLVVSGTTVNVKTLSLSLYNAETDKVTQEAELQSDGGFTVSFAIEQLTAGNGTWYRLKYDANNTGLITLSYYDGFDTSVDYLSTTRRYYFTTAYNNTDFALVYASRTYNCVITSATITEESGKAILTVTGTVDNDIPASDISLLLDKTSETKQQLTVQNAATEEGKFSFVYDVSELLLSTQITQTQEEGYFMRLVVYGNNVNISSERVKEQLFEVVEVGDYTYYFYRNSLTAYNTLGIVRIASSALDTTPVVNAGSVSLENGSFVFSGTVKNVEKLYVYLINTNVAESTNNYVEAVIAADGSFTATLSLDTLAGFAKTSTPFNLRYKIDSLDSAIVNVVQGSMDLSQQYAYGNYTYALGLNGTNVRVQYTAHGYAYNITTATITEIDGKACLTLAGTLSDNTVAATSLTLILNKTSGTAETLTYQNEATEAGTFRFVIDISEIATSTAAATNANHYFIRLYKDGAKLYDINSVWAGDKIFEPVEIGDSVYYFSKNNATAYYTLGVIRVEKTEG